MAVAKVVATLVLLGVNASSNYHELKPTREARVIDLSTLKVRGITTTTAPPTTTSRPRLPQPARVRESGARPPINGDALLHRIMMCESGGNPTIANKRSTASGLFQYLDSTWSNYKGYARAMYAPPAIQWERARMDFARLGTRPWAASRGCWA